MPTGYTADIAKGISFERFALECARAFGATILMRDEPAGTEIPVFQPNTFHADQIEAAKRDIAKFEAMTDAEAEPIALSEYLDAVETNEMRRKGYRELRTKYEAML